MIYSSLPDMYGLVLVWEEQQFSFLILTPQYIVTPGKTTRDERRRQISHIGCFRGFLYTGRCDTIFG